MPEIAIAFSAAGNISGELPALTGFEGLGHDLYALERGCGA